MSKKLLVAAAVAAVAVSSSAFADMNKQGFYVGGNLGWSRANDGDVLKDTLSKIVKVDSTEGGFGWRALAGYNINRNFAVEGGYTAYANNKYKLNNSGEIKEKVSAWDLVAKASMPIADSNFDVFAKAGAAYQKNEYTANGNGQSLKLDSKTSVRPIAGVGAAYNFDNGMAVDISWTRVFGNKSDENRIGQPDSDLVALGVTYTFQNWA